MTESTEKYASVPDEMKALTQWVIWGIDSGSPKIPHNPHNSTVRAKANDPGTWGGFAAAAAAAGGLGRGGIGFELGNGIAGLDLDHVIDEAGELNTDARRIVEMMNSYTELSPSGRGLHILFKVNMSEQEIRERLGGKLGTRRGGLELYFGEHYFTVTGKPYGEVKPLEKRTQEALQIYAKYLAKPAPKKQQERAEYSPERKNSASLTNQELWERMFEVPQNGRNIRALYDGDISDYASASEADLALCSHLAYWTGNDVGRIDEMFRESGLLREKWERADYREATISKAIDSTRPYSYSASSWHEEFTKTREAGAAKPHPQELIVDAMQLRAVSEYLNSFLAQLLKSREGKAISTGFEAMDEILYGGLYPGLYFIGAISALGKTTLALQIADNIAQGGHGVMIVSLEMSRTELMAKTLSRESLVQALSRGEGWSKASTTREILSSAFSSDTQKAGLVKDALLEYAEWGKNVIILEGVSDIGTGAIRKYVEAYMNEHDGGVPVLVIDYLQILAPVEKRASDKQNTDWNVTELKRISRDYQLPIIGISSFNRENYNAPVSMAAFKESGAIEYSSDVLIGLQIAGIDRKTGEKENEYKERLQKTLDAASTARRHGKPIAIEAKILKQRNGVTGTVELEFYSKFNYFRERGSTI